MSAQCVSSTSLPGALPIPMQKVGQRGAELKEEVWIGPGNDECIAFQSRHAHLVIAAWGGSSTRTKGALWRAEEVQRLLSNPWCLEHPGASHPYYAGPRGARADALIVPLNVARSRTSK